jgi:hypothetical protein
VTAFAQRARPRGARFGPRFTALAAGGLALAALAFTAMIAALGGASLFSLAPAGPGEEKPGASPLAERDIPPPYLRLYMQAAAKYGLDWAVLAAIGKVECDHGADPDPACTQEGHVNGAGAGGPMQFLASTWSTYGVTPSGTGTPDRWNPADAIFSAANYLRASGAPGDYRQAIYAYNHSTQYVQAVESWAARYRGASTGAPGSGAPSLSEGAGREGEGEEALAGADLALAAHTPTAVRFIPGRRAQLSPADGHLALVPAGAPAVVQAMVVAGNELQDLPYGPGGHPDPLGASDEDCSSSVNYVLYRSGVRGLGEIVRENPLAQDYVSWGEPGPGRWVTIYATDSPTPHVFITIAGLRLDTVGGGEDEGPNREQSGPRWRLLDRIPTWAHWSVRHPPGL